MDFRRVTSHGNSDDQQIPESWQAVAEIYNATDDDYFHVLDKLDQAGISEHDAFFHYWQDNIDSVMKLENRCEPRYPMSWDCSVLVKWWNGSHGAQIRSNSSPTDRQNYDAAPEPAPIHKEESTVRPKNRGRFYHDPGPGLMYEIDGESYQCFNTNGDAYYFDYNHNREYPTGFTYDEAVRIANNASPEPSRYCYEEPQTFSEVSDTDGELPF